MFRPAHAVFTVACLAAAAAAHAAPDAALLAQAERSTPVLLDTLKDLVEIESGSGDREGLDRAGGSPDAGRNAIYELGHQIMQTRDFSEPAKGIKINWTMIGGGTNRNVIPDEAHAQADVRTTLASDFDVLEQRLRAAMKNQLIPDTRVHMVLERRRPPFVGSASGMAVAAHAVKIYGEIGKTVGISATATGGGTDACFAAGPNGNAVVEGFGLSGGGAHSSDAEYVLIDSIAPRLYLTTRLIIDFSRGEGALR